MRKTRYRQNPLLFGEVDLELFFVTEVLKLRSLHYGYWDVGVKPQLAPGDVVAAQARYTEELLRFVPEETRTILDVGSGIGDNAVACADRGFEVTALSPDKNHARYYPTDEQRRIAFHPVRYEDFSSQRRFDLLLFSESVNAMDWEVALQQSRRLVRPGGRMLISAVFRNPGDRPYPDDFALEDLPYVQLARRYGFTLEAARDITENCVPTLELAFAILTERLPPMLSVAEHFLRHSSPAKLALIKFFFRRQLKQLESLQSRYERILDPTLFRQCSRYVILRFRHVP